MACFHTAGVTCDECRGAVQRQQEMSLAGLAIVYDENRELREQAGYYRDMAEAYKATSEERGARLTALENLIAVLSHPRFFRVERSHYGHVGDCPQEAWPGMPCWMYDVGVAIREGRVDWWHGATWQDAVAKAADAIGGREPFCACGRRRSECDGTRAACMTTP